MMGYQKQQGMMLCRLTKRKWGMIDSEHAMCKLHICLQHLTAQCRNHPNMFLSNPHTHPVPRDEDMFGKDCIQIMNTCSNQVAEYFRNAVDNDNWNEAMPTGCHPTEDSERF